MHAPDLTARPTEIPAVPQSMRARAFNAHSLRGFRRLFITLPTPDAATLSGHFRAEFVGPDWLRKIAPAALALGGLGGWWGKTFATDGRGINLVRRERHIAPIMPVYLGLADSMIDRRPCLAVTYPAGSPFPWPRVVDELRFLDNDTLLGLTLLNLRGLRRVAFPFLLHHTPNLPIA